MEMSDRNIISAMAASFLAPFVEIIGAMKWFFVLAPILILCDLWFGIQAAKKRGEKIKKSRAIRRTINKVVDYLCWIFLAATIGQAIGNPLDIPILPIIIMCIVIGVEFESCVVNYFESKGKKVRFNVWKLFGKKIEDSIDLDMKDENAGVKH